MADVMHLPTMSYAGKVMTLGVVLKAILMSAIVTVLAATTFAESIILVLVSAAATGVFALLVVLVQTHYQHTIHIRIDKLEERAREAQTTAEGTQEIAARNQEVVAAIGAAVGADVPAATEPAQP